MRQETGQFMEAVNFDLMSDQETRAKLAEIAGNTPGAFVATGLPLVKSTIDLFWQSFKCKQCGDCCRRAMKIVLQPHEIIPLAETFQLTPRHFKRHCTFTQDRMRFLNTPCVFFDDHTGICSVYGKHPTACRNYPINVPQWDDDIAILSINITCEAAQDAAAKMLQYRRDLTKLHPEEMRRRLALLGMQSRDAIVAEQKSTMRFTVNVQKQYP